jgi:hypothetical protein
MAGRVPAVALTIAFAFAGVAAAQDDNPPPSETPDAPVAASPMPVTFPLPEIVAVIPPDIPTVTLGPESAPADIGSGVPVPFTLGHCGLLSPVDLDGSFWQPVSGTDGDGGPIEGDDAVSELINATSGELVLTTPDAAVFTTASGSQIQLLRADAAADYSLCM